MIFRMIIKVLEFKATFVLCCWNTQKHSEVCLFVSVPISQNLLAQFSNKPSFSGTLLISLDHMIINKYVRLYMLTSLFSWKIKFSKNDFHCQIHYKGLFDQLWTGHVHSVLTLTFHQLNESETVFFVVFADFLISKESKYCYVLYQFRWLFGYDPNSE